MLIKYSFGTEVYNYESNSGKNNFCQKIIRFSSLQGKRLLVI